MVQSWVLFSVGAVQCSAVQCNAMHNSAVQYSVKHNIESCVEQFSVVQCSVKRNVQSIIHSVQVAFIKNQIIPFIKYPSFKSGQWINGGKSNQNKCAIFKFSSKLIIIIESIYFIYYMDFLFVTIILVQIKFIQIIIR